MTPDSGFGDMAGCWYSLFALHHADTIGRVEEFTLEAPELQGDLPFSEADLDRVIAKTSVMEAWLSQFESGSGNPISVVALIGAWPDGDPQNHPRLVTAYWRGWCPRDGEASDRGLSSRLMARFERAPLEAKVLADVEIWDAADEVLRSAMDHPV